MTKSVFLKEYERLCGCGLNTQLSLQDVLTLERFTRGVYAEIGTANGGSAWLASLKAELAYTIDRERRPHIWEIKGYERPNIIFEEGVSVDVARNWRYWAGDAIDTLFIDGDHSYQGVTKDLMAWVPHLRKEATIMFHDFAYSSPGVMQAALNFILMGDVDGKIYWPIENSSILTVTYHIR